MEQMNTGAKHNEWARGSLFLMASLTTTLYGAGYMLLLHPLVIAFLLAQLCFLLVVLAPHEWRSRRYQMVGVGLVLVAAPFLVSTGLITNTPSVVAASFIEDWGLVLFAIGGAIIAIGSLSYAASLFLAPPPATPARKKTGCVSCSYLRLKPGLLRPTAVPAFSFAEETL